METLKLTVGIDVSKDDCKCNLSKMTSELTVKVIASKTFLNNEKDLQELLKWVAKNSAGYGPLRTGIVIEASGVYHERFALGLQQAGHRVSVVLPNKAKKYMQLLRVMEMQMIRFIRHHYLQKETVLLRQCNKR